MNQPDKSNWWNRNWKWFVPVGCLSSLVLMAGFMAILMYFIFGMMKSSDAYKEALILAKANATVTESLGTPIQEGTFISGNINVSGPSGNANLSIPIYGPKEAGTIYLVAHKSAGQWSFRTLVVEINSSKKRINLLEQP